MYREWGVVEAACADTRLFYTHMRKTAFATELSGELNIFVFIPSSLFFLLSAFLLFSLPLLLLYSKRSSPSILFLSKRVFPSCHNYDFSTSTPFFTPLLPPTSTSQFSWKRYIYHFCYFSSNSWIQRKLEIYLNSYSPNQLSLQYIQGIMQIVGALQSAAIFRLKKTWDGISK